MIDSVENTPIIGLKGSNLHLIQINFDHWDISTRESNPSGEATKCENIAENKSNNKKVLRSNKKKNNNNLKNDTILNKKTKRLKVKKIIKNLKKKKIKIINII